MRKGTKFIVALSTAAITFGIWMMVLGKPQTHHFRSCHPHTMGSSEIRK